MSSGKAPLQMTMDSLKAQTLQLQQLHLKILVGFHLISQFLSSLTPITTLFITAVVQIKC